MHILKYPPAPALLSHLIHTCRLVPATLKVGGLELRCLGGAQVRIPAKTLAGGPIFARFARPTPLCPINAARLVRLCQTFGFLLFQFLGLARDFIILDQYTDQGSVSHVSMRENGL